MAYEAPQTTQSQHCMGLFFSSLFVASFLYLRCHRCCSSTGCRLSTRWSGCWSWWDSCSCRWCSCSCCCPSCCCQSCAWGTRGRGCLQIQGCVGPETTRRPLRPLGGQQQQQVVEEKEEEEALQPRERLKRLAGVAGRM